MPDFLLLMASFIDSPLGYLILILVVAIAIHEYRSTR